jgi:hypothetical protein
MEIGDESDQFIEDGRLHHVAVCSEGAGTGEVRDVVRGGEDDHRHRDEPTIRTQVTEESAPISVTEVPVQQYQRRQDAPVILEKTKCRVSLVLYIEHRVISTMGECLAK